MRGKIVSKVIELGRNSLRVGMGMDMSKGRVISHGLPDVKDPMIQGACRIVFKVKGRWVVGEGADGIKVVGVNGRLLGKISCKYGGSSNCIGFTMLNASRGIGREGCYQGVSICNHSKCG